MSSTIKLKRSGVGGAVPSTSAISEGEIFLNYYDGKLFFLKNQGGTKSIVTLSAASGGGASALADLSDVSLSTPTSGQILKYNGTEWTNSSTLPASSVTGLATVATSGAYSDLSGKPTIPSALDDLSDVTITSAASGEILKYNGTAWVNVSTVPATAVSGLATVATTGAYSDLNGRPSIPSTLDDLSDVTITSATSGQLIKHNGTAWVNVSSIPATSVSGLATVASSGAYSDLSGRPTLATVATTGAYSDLTGRPSVPSTLDDLSDVTITSATSGQLIKYNGTAWVNVSTIPSTAVSGLATVATTGAYADLSGRPSLATVATSGAYNDLTGKPSIPSTLDNLSDVTITSAATGEILKYNGTEWVNASSLAAGQVTGLATVATSGSYNDLTSKPTIPTTLAALTGDVTISAPSANQVLQYNGTKWVNGATSGGASNLDGLSDVAITSAATGQFIVHDGTQFINSRTISSGSATPITTISSGGTSAEFKSSAGYNGFRVGCNSTTGVPYVALDTNSAQKAYFAYWGDGAARTSLGYSGSTDVINYGTGGTYEGRVGIQTTTPSGQLGVTCALATNKGLVVKAAASQSANLLEVQNSSGTALTSFSSTGNVGVGADPISTSRLNLVGASATSSDFTIVCKDSASANQFYVRCDGLIFTGTSTNSPYNNTTGSAANVYVGSNGLLYRNSSSLKYKIDVQPATHGLAEVLQLQPVTYKTRTDGDTIYGGLIAEAVHAVGLTEFVQYADDGTPDALAYGQMVSLAFKAIQELNAKVERLEAALAVLSPTQG